MIGWLNGHIVDRHTPGKLVLDVHGVGYDVETSLQTFFNLESHKDAIGLHIHTVVREDALLLYGFLDKEERALFRALIKVNGVGPKLAMTILSSITPDDFIQCIQQENALLLTKLPGVGKKTAERLVVEMKDSIAHLPQSANVNQSPILTVKAADEAVRALEALGYKHQEALKAVDKIADLNLTCEEIIRKALQIISGR